jgi:amylosucrase
MNNYDYHKHIEEVLHNPETENTGKENLLQKRMSAHADAIYSLYAEVYGQHPKGAANFPKLISTIAEAFNGREKSLKKRDEAKEKKGNWFLSNEITGMSLYVDRFCGNLINLGNKLDYFKKLGVNFLHLMPVFESPEGESDGGYAVSDFRKVDKRFGTLVDFEKLEKKLRKEDMYLMIDIVLNHTSHHHEWAEKAKQGDKYYQDFFYMYDDRYLPDQYEQAMPEIFPESAPGSFTYNKECGKWVMTVFHDYQWDLNYSNPDVFIAMLENIFFYANLGIDILRIDAPAFIWKQIGTTCQNLPKAHTILQLIKQCVQVATPGMALLGEAIVAPKEIINYFGTGNYTAKECDVAYAATNMALQWDALATGNIKVMYAAQHEILRKPFGTTWITYTRCHDDIGLGYDDYMIEAAGFNPYEHRKFLKNYYAGNHNGSPATGALFSVNPKTQDARISGSLASLCGLEKALKENNKNEIELSVRKILLMQAQGFFIGGIPMLFYGDETGHINDYSYLNDNGKSYDNRWMHRPIIDWGKTDDIDREGTIEHRIFSATQKLIALRKKITVVPDYSNITWLTPYNIHVGGYLRAWEDKKLFCLYNYSDKTTFVTWYTFRENGTTGKLYDHWHEKQIAVGNDNEYLIIEPYDFCLLETM